MTGGFLVNWRGWDALGDALVHSLWQGPLLLVVGLLGESLARRRPQRAFALSCGLLFFMPVFAMVAAGGAFSEVSRRVVELSSRSRGFEDVVKASEPLGAPWTNVAVGATWACLVMLLMIRNLAANRYTRNRLLRRCRELDAARRQRFACMAARLGLTKPVRFLVSREEEVPLTLGWLRPVVVVPESMLSTSSTDLVEPLLWHELVHVRRRDYPIALVQRFVRCWFFYNPAVWLLSKLTDQYRELACDREVLSLGLDPRRYAAALVELEGLRQRTPAVSAGGGELLWRVRAILGLSTTAERRAWSRWAAAVGLATLGFAVVACSDRVSTGTSVDVDAFTVELFESAPARVNGTPVRGTAEIAEQASHADRLGRAWVLAQGNVPFERVIDVLDTLQQAGLARVAFSRVAPDEAHADQ